MQFVKQLVTVTKKYKNKDTDSDGLEQVGLSKMSSKSESPVKSMKSGMKFPTQLNMNYAILSNSL